MVYPASDISIIKIIIIINVSDYCTILIIPLIVYVVKLHVSIVTVLPLILSMADTTTSYEQPGNRSLSIISLGNCPSLYIRLLLDCAAIQV